MQKIFLLVTIFFMLSGQHKTNNSFTNKWSNEGDISSKELLTFDLKSNKSKITGSAYFTKENGEGNGILSVNGYIKKNIAYIRFRTDNNSILGDGTLQIKNNFLVFKQTTKSIWLPKIAYCTKTN